MNGAPPLGAAVAGGVHLRRCVRHPSREAAARCPSCKEFFCRECVVEHEGRLICGPCLGRVTAKAERKRQRWAAVGRYGIALAGLLALWLAFILVGALLLRIPPEFHEGTIWKRAISSP